MVTTFFPATSDMAMPQERIASPLRCTVQAPQSATPQPNFVPVRPSSSRRYHISGIDGSPSNVRDWPFTFRLTIISSAGGLLSPGLPPHSSVTSPIFGAPIDAHRHVRPDKVGNVSVFVTRT